MEAKHKVRAINSAHAMNFCYAYVATDSVTVRLLYHSILCATARLRCCNDVPSVGA